MTIARAAWVRPRRQAASADRVSLWRTPRARSLLLLLSVGSVGGVLWLGSRVYTDLLWFDEVGHQAVFWETLKWKVLTQALVILGGATFLLANLAVADWASRARASPARAWPPLARAWPYRRLVFPVVAIAGGLLVRSWCDEGAWRLLALWSHRGDFGALDPLSHRDVGFFVFSLPLYRQVSVLLLVAIALAAVVTVAAYMASGVIQVTPPRGVGRPARGHLLALAALGLLVMGWRYQLDRYALALPQEGARVPGAGYVDHRVRLPALQVLTAISFVGAALCAHAAWQRTLRVPALVLALLAGVAFAGESTLPAVIDRFEVQPQELARARPYVADAIASTRRAYGLDAVDVRSLSGEAPLTRARIAANRRTVENVPVWDPPVLRPAMNELQAIGQYYSFPSTTVDRYTIGGVPRLVTIGARELDRREAPTADRSWATDRFAYTHGYGVAAVKADGTDSDRHPRFAQGGFAASRNPLGVRQPRIYFGEQPDHRPPYVVANTGRAEVDQPLPGSRAPGYHYRGSAGIAMSNPLRRIAFAARFGDLRLLLTPTVTESSRLLLHRDVGERLRTLAPFLRWDSHPQTTVVDGRVTFLFHGYTTTGDYPYSAPVEMDGARVNYVRAAVNASVDAFSGRVSIYAAEPEDPILRAWRAVYPGLVQPASRMPAGMRAHLRYPRALFDAQATAYATYHAGDPTGFWNGADAWQRPVQLAGPVELVGEVRLPNPEDRIDPDERREAGVTPDSFRMKAAYLFARLPGDARERLLLATPFTPRGRENLAAYLAGWTDAAGRPRLTLLSLPRDRLTLGPSQATRRILETPAVNHELELLNRESRDLGRNAVNRTVLGVPRLVPIDRSVVQVQPVYLTAGGSGVPRLQLVTAHANGRVGYGRDVEAALRATTR